MPDQFSRQLVLVCAAALLLIGLLVVVLERRNRQLALSRQALTAALAERNPVLAALPDLISMKDLQGNYISCNTAFAELFSGDEAAVIGKKDRDLLDTQTARRWRAGDRAAIEAGQAVHVQEWLALPARGFTALMQFTRKPVYDADGHLFGVISIARDVTVQHRVEEQLKRRESYQRALLDNAPFLVWLKDTEGRFLAVNQPFADAAGHGTPRELIHKTDLDIWPRELAEAYRADDRGVMVSRRKKEVEEQVVCGDERKWFETYKSPVIDLDGKLVGTVGFARDISERREMENALRESEARFHNFFRSHSSILILLEPESGELFDVNDAAADFYGCQREQLIGMSIDQINTLPAEQNQALRLKVVRGELSYYEMRQRLADGDTRDVEVYSSSMNTGGRDLLFSIVHDVTERKRVARELQQERELFSSGPVAVFTWEPSEGWPVRWVSSNCKEVLGYSVDEVTTDGFRFADLVHPDDLPRIGDEIQHYLGAKTDQFEQSYRLRHKDHGYTWFHDFTRVIRSTEGEIESIRGFIFDQSQTKRLELALARERERLQYVIEGTGVGTWEWNVRTGETHFNERWAEIIGYRLDELLPVSIDTWTEHSHPDDRERSEAVLKRHFAGETDQYECETRMRHRDGHWLWVLVRGRVFRWTDDGRPLWMYGTHQDITERKEAEIRLRESEHRLRVAGLSAYDLLYERDMVDGPLMWFGDAGKILGCPADQVPDTIEHWLALIHPDDRSRVQQAMARRDGPGKPYECRYRIRHSDGNWRYWQDKAVPLFDDRGEPIKIVGVCSDITEQHKADERQRLAATVFNHAHDGILITDADARIIDVNHAFTTISGYTREEAVGRNPRFLSSGRQNKAFYDTMWRTLNAKDYWTGEIWNRRKDGREYAELLAISAVRGDDGKVQRYVALFSDITTQKEQQSRLEHIAYHDALTNLPNRVLLGDRLRHSMRRADRNSTLLAVVYLDLDGFKEINDVYGHDVGDRALIEVANRLQRVLRDDDTLGRLGGDEFIAIMSDLNTPSDCIALLPRMLRAVARPLDAVQAEVAVTASLGVALYPQAQALDPDQLLRQADQAMYQAKLAGKNRYHFFDSEQDQHIRGQVERIEEVRHALETEAFVLHYQPKVNMRTGDVLGVEALIRWPLDDGSMRLPGEFLPLIENDPLAAVLDEWVIDQALTQLEQWHAAGINISVSANVSAYQLQQADFVERLLALLQRHPTVGPGDLIIEVLETTALIDLKRMSEVIRIAQDAGMVFALDDFGTGYSSLDYLKNLPARQLKIDRGFVRDMLDDRDDLAILEGIVGLASAFRRELVAEGVESVEHGEILINLGCEIAQGFGIGRPMPADQVERWIESWEPYPSWCTKERISRDDLPLVFAMVEHRAWVKALQSQLNGKQLPRPELTPEKCNFGCWLDGEGGRRYGGHRGFNGIRRLHNEIHELAPRILDLHARGEPEVAQQRLSDLMVLRDALLSQLKALLHTST